MPLISRTTTGSLPTTQASCPGGKSDTSPGPNSASLPSSMRTPRRPERWYCRCGAWQLAVFEVAWESGSSHPGFLLLDSPQKNLGQTGERDAEFADTITVADIYRHLQRWLAGRGAGAQIIVADNAPPVEADPDVIVRFSRRTDQPPYGLIDDETE